MTELNKNFNRHKNRWRKLLDKTTLLLFIACHLKLKKNTFGNFSMMGDAEKSEILGSLEMQEVVKAKEWLMFNSIHLNLYRELY